MTKGRSAFPRFAIDRSVIAISVASALLVSCASSRKGKGVANASESRFELAPETRKSHATSEVPPPQAMAPIIFGTTDRRALLNDGTHQGAWTVSLAQAQTADSVMHILTVQQRPAVGIRIDSYYGQFVGWTNDAGEQLIHMQFFCEQYVAFMMSNGALANDWPRFDLSQQQDGGSCFFQANFDPVTGAATDFSVNSD